MVEVIWFTEWLIAMSWLPKREKLDPKQASAIDFAVAQGGNFYVSGEADSYDSQTCTDLERLAVLQPSDDQGALFGKSWSKKEAKA